jgi:hypothetical protein
MHDGVGPVRALNRRIPAAATGPTLVALLFACGWERTWYVVSGTIQGRQQATGGWIELGDGRRAVAVVGFDVEDPPLESFEWLWLGRGWCRHAPTLVPGPASWWETLRGADQRNGPCTIFPSSPTPRVRGWRSSSGAARGNDPGAGDLSPAPVCHLPPAPGVLLPTLVHPPHPTARRPAHRRRLLLLPLHHHALGGQQQSNVFAAA